MIIGHLVCWCFEQPKIKREVFNELCRQRSLPQIPKPKPSPAMSATLDQCRKRLKDRHWHISRIKTVDTKKFYGIYQYERDEEWEDLKIEQVAVMEFDYKTGELTCDWPHPSFERIKKIYNYYCSMVSYSDLLTWTEKWLAYTDAVCIRERGGLYFVPEVDKDLLDNFCEVVNAIPGKCYVDCIPQIDSVDLRRAIHRFFGPWADRTMERIRTWVYPEIKALLIEDIDLRLNKLWAFGRQLSYYNRLIGYPHETYAAEVRDFIKQYNKRREEVMDLVFTVRQRTLYWDNRRLIDERATKESKAGET